MGKNEPMQVQGLGGWLAAALLLWGGAGQAPAAVVFQDQFNDGVYYSASVLAADGVTVETVNPMYWTFSQLIGESLVLGENNGRLEIVTDSSFGAGIVLYGMQSNLDVQCPAGQAAGCVDPRLYFFNDPQIDPAAERTVVVEGLEITGINHPSYYAFKLRLGSTPGGLPFRSHLEVSLSGDKELRLITKAGALNAVALFRNFYLQEIPHRVSLTLGPQRYTIKLDFDFPAQPDLASQPLLSGSVSYTGEHGLDMATWLQETNGVEGAALFIGAASTDPQGSLARVSIDSVTVYDGADAIGLCQ